MFGFLKRRRAQVHQQWMAPIGDFGSSVDEFYSAIETVIRERELPPMQIIRIPWREGGLLSSGREYLRIMRERLVFDVGCGPFGTYWFYSCRGAIIPRSLTLLSVLMALLTLGSFLLIFVASFGWTYGCILLLLTIASAAGLMICAGKWPGLDEALIHTPCVGVIYEALLRRETYWRQDIRRMWLSTIDGIVREQAEEFAKAGGVHELHFYDIPDPEQPAGMRDRASNLIQEILRMYTMQSPGGAVSTDSSGQAPRPPHH